MITAGLNTKIMAELGIRTSVQAAASKIELSLSERLQGACVRAATSTTIHTIDGDSFQDSLLSGVISGTADVIAGLAAHEVGEDLESTILFHPKLAQKFRYSKGIQFLTDKEAPC